MADKSNVEDTESDAATKRSVTLYKISDASGSLEVSEVSGLPLKQEMLNAQVILKNRNIYLRDLLGVSTKSY